MCLVLLPDLYQSLSPQSSDGGGRGLLSSLLLTLARMPGLGEFLPQMQMQQQGTRARSAGRERQKEKEAHVMKDVQVLLKSVLLELQGLASKDADTMSRQVMSQVANTSSLTRTPTPGGGHVFFLFFIFLAPDCGRNDPILSLSHE